MPETPAPENLAPENPARHTGPDTPGYEAYVGPVRALEAPGGQVRIGFTIEPRHLNGADMLHGGMMMSFAAIALAHAARAAVADRPGSAVEAMSINCDFTGPGRPGDEAVATARVTRATRTVVFCACDIEADTRMLMTATGVFRVGAP